MSVVLYVPFPLRAFSEGKGRVQIDTTPPTVREALESLWPTCPGLRERIITEQGEIRRHINVFVGDENIRHTGGLSTPLSGDVEISILPAVSGGAE